MGVHGLWEIVGPTARPVRLEALSRRKLAVDASIWIYQFLKAVRDKEGNAMKNAHIVGFFRRICKLLYFGINPVFVFDGGAPVLKRQTIKARKERRESKRKTVQETAQKLLAIQLQKKADKQYNDKIGNSGTRVKSKSESTVKEVPIETLQYDEYYEDNNYLDGNGGSSISQNSSPNKQLNSANNNTSTKNKIFRKDDEYDLPTMKEVKYENDNRLITDYEYERLTSDLRDEIGDIDMDKIDPTSEEFEELPLATQYIILSHLRLRSRLRMGYTKSQLETLFPNSMDFSRFQIDMVKKRNYLTQRLLNASGFEAMETVNRRIASEKDKSYVLQKNDNGWTLSIDDNKGDTAENAVTIDDNDKEYGYDHFDYKDLSDGDDNDELFKDKVEKEEVDKSVRFAIDESKKVEHVTDAVKQVDNDEGAEEDNDVDFEWENVDIEKQDDLKKETPSQIPSSNSDALFISDNNDGDNSEAESDPEMEMALIESIYQYSAKHGKKKQEDGNKIEELKVQDENETMSEEEQLKLAIKRSRDEYFNLRQREDDMNKAVKNSSNTSREEIGRLMKDVSNDNLEKELPIVLTKFSFENSLMNPSYRGPNGGDKIKKQVNNTEIKDKKQGQVNNGKKDDEIEKKKKNILPSWFDNHSVTSAQNDSEINYRSHKISYNEMSKNDDIEQDQIISWTEAQKYMDDGDDFEDYKEVSNAEPETVVVDDEVEDDDDVQEIDFEDVSIGKSNKSTDDDPADTEFVEVEGIDYTDELRANNESIMRNKHITIGDSDVVEYSTKSTKSPVSPAPQKIQDTLKPSSETKDKEIEVIGDYEFSEDEEERLVTQLDDEQDAYNKFVGDLQSKAGTGAGSNSNGQSFWSLDKERELQEQNKKDKRDSDDVTVLMVQEVQDLLERFGIPFITAPMEAEAQCAELYRLGLVDGIITDDSDCFLFGGAKVYKNMFNEKNYVECYTYEDIERDLGLSREKMIELALLLGSDYTDGIKGIGVVNGMELLAEFDTKSESNDKIIGSGSLINFRNWWIDYQNGIEIDIKETNFKKSLRKKLKKSELYLNKNFPDSLVFEAYINPEVDHDKTEFQWGSPDLDRLRTFLIYTVGWSQSKVDEILVPLIKDLNKKKREGTQSTMGEFFPVEYLQKRRKLGLGKRLQDATLRLSGKSRSSEGNGDLQIENHDNIPVVSKVKRKKKKTN